MNEYKIKLLDYISKNYDNVVKQSRNGEYIEIDLIPGSHDDLHELSEILEYCDKNDIDVYMFKHSYSINNDDGLRMNRYMYYMCDTTKQILNDLKIRQRITKIKKLKN
jgi:hypothetical protein